MKKVGERQGRCKDHHRQGREGENGTENINLGSLAEGRGNGGRVSGRRGKVVGGDRLESWCCGETMEGGFLSGRRRRQVVREELGGKGKISTIEGLGW